MMRGQKNINLHILFIRT